MKRSKCETIDEKPNEKTINTTYTRRQQSCHFLGVHSFAIFIYSVCVCLWFFLFFILLPFSLGALLARLIELRMKNKFTSPAAEHARIQLCSCVHVNKIQVIKCKTQRDSSQLEIEQCELNIIPCDCTNFAHFFPEPSIDDELSLWMCDVISVHTNVFDGIWWRCSRSNVCTIPNSHE